MPNKENIAAVAAAKKDLEGAAAIYVSHNLSLNVEEATELRNRLRAAKATHKVIKNTLAAIAAKELGLEGVNSHLTGPTMLTICRGDIAAPAKVLVEFAKEHPHLAVVGGLLEGKVATKADIEAVATLPPREVLLARLCATLNSPITRFVRTINNPVRELAVVLNAVAEQKAA
jgi:large subunit ribosomal protein L10